MRFRRLPDDLVAILGFTLLVPGIIFIPVFRNTPTRLVIGIPFVLFVPGYVLVSALYPANSDSNEADTDNGLEDKSITPLERTALSFVFSMILVSIVGFVLNSTPFGLRLAPILVALTGVVIALVIIADWRRRALPPEHRLVVPWREKLRSIRAELFEPESRTIAVLNTLLLTSILLAATTAGYILMTPAEDEGFTEFYLLTEDGELAVEEYPTEFVAGESQRLVVGVRNQEYQTMNYTILVDIRRVQVEENSTQILESERLRTFETQIEHNETWQRSHTVAPELTGEQLRLTYRLYRGDPPASPSTEPAYRRLQLTVNVTSGG